MHGVFMLSFPTVFSLPLFPIPQSFHAPYSCCTVFTSCQHCECQKCILILGSSRNVISSHAVLHNVYGFADNKGLIDYLT